MRDCARDISAALSAGSLLMRRPEARPDEWISRAAGMGEIVSCGSADNAMASSVKLRHMSSARRLIWRSADGEMPISVAVLF
jgi:hypothetical protein